MAPSSTFASELWHLVYLFHILAILIDVIPLLILCHVSDWRNVDKYFPMRPFLTAAFMNYMLVCHILFALDPNEHLAALFVAMAGMLLGIMCAFIRLLQKLVVRKSLRTRVEMYSLILSLLVGSSAIIYGIDVQFKANEGWGIAIFLVAVGGTSILMAYPILSAMFCGLKVGPDIKVDALGFVISFLTTLDAWYFVGYTHVLDSFDTLLSLIAFITALFSSSQFFLFLGKMHAIRPADHED